MGDTRLPCDPAPGMGGLLLGGVIATFGPFLDDEARVDTIALMGEIERGQRIPQPRLRHRFQTDHIGLQRIAYRLVAHGETLSFDFQPERATPVQHVLTAVYGVATVDRAHRRGLMSALRRSLTFPGGSDADLIRYLSGSRSTTIAALSDPVLWAMEVLRIESGRQGLPNRREVQRAFRGQLRSAHPDHGAERIGAAKRIADLSEARRILLNR